jgi:hypothetical protein
MLVRLSETIRLLLLFTRRKEEPKTERDKREAKRYRMFSRTSTRKKNDE